MEPVSPLAAQQEVRFKLPAPTDGEGGHALSRRGRRGRRQRARLRRLGAAAARRAGPAGPAAARRARRDARAGRAPRADLRQRREVSGRRRRSRRAARARPTSRELAQKHGVEAGRARGLARLSRHRRGRAGRSSTATSPSKISKRRRATTSSRAGAATRRRSVVANSSDQHVRIPGNMKPHSVAVHPSPTLRVAVGWRSPVAATLRVEGDGAARASRVRQRRDLVAGTAPRQRRGSGSPPASRRAARKSRSARSRTSPCSRATWSRC